MTWRLFVGGVHVATFTRVGRACVGVDLRDNSIGTCEIAEGLPHEPLVTAWLGAEPEYREATDVAA